MAAGNDINRRNAVQQSGFPGAGRTHNTEKLTFTHRERNMIDGFCQVALVTVKFLDVIHP